MRADLRGFAGPSCFRCLAVLIGITFLLLVWVGNSRTDTIVLPSNYQSECHYSVPCRCSPPNLPEHATNRKPQPDDLASSQDWRLGTDKTPTGNLTSNDTIVYPTPAVRLVMIDECLKKLNLFDDEQDDHLYDETKVHVIFGIWLPAGQPLVHATVEPQLYEVYSSGLFTRPNTYVHIVVSTNSSDELVWLKSLAVWQHIPHYEIIHSYWNLFEFPAIRTMWELACKDPDAIYVYFHNKGARYGQGRLTHELILTRQIILPWKSMLTLFMNDASIPHIGVGGPGWQWMNFYWVQGSYLYNSPIPIRSDDRYYYEYYISNRANPNQCHLATGFASAILESPTPSPENPRIENSFSVDTCDTRSIDAETILNTVFRADRVELVGP